MIRGLLLCVCAALAAEADDAAWETVRRLPRGSEIRVTVANHRPVRGFLLEAAADSLQINAPTSTESLARADVRRVELKTPGHRGRNTLIGFGTGVGIGLAAGAILDSKSTADFFPNAGKAVFSGLGAIIGTVVGVALPTGRWHVIFAAP